MYILISMIPHIRVAYTARYTMRICPCRNFEHLYKCVPVFLVGVVRNIKIYKILIFESTFLLKNAACNFTPARDFLKPYHDDVCEATVRSFILLTIVEGVNMYPPLIKARLCAALT